jgi:hypothetical protein
MRPRLTLAIAVLAGGLLASSAFGAAEDLRITAGPSGLTVEAAPEFAFLATPEPVSVSCRVDGAVTAPCESPYQSARLGDGPHVFEVRADFGGTVRTAHRSFTVDTAPPAITVDAPTGPIDALVASVTFSSAEDGVEFTCALDSGAAAPCTSPYVTPELPNGSHAVHVQAADAAGNVAGASRLLSIAATPPDTTIEAGFESASKDATPEFGFRSSRAGSRFQCSLDSAAWAECPATYTTPELTVGPHELAARAIDGAGNVDPSPAVKAFEVVECRTQVTFGVIDARAADCFRREGTAFVADGAVKVNGITFNPLGKRKLRVDPERKTLSLGQIQLRIGSIVLYQGELEWTVPEGNRVTLARFDLASFQRSDVSPTGDVEGALDLEGEDSANVKGFDLKGEAVLELADGGAELTGTIELPKVFTDAEGNGLTGSVTVRSDNDHGLRLDAIRVNAPLAMVGNLELHNLWVAFAGAHNNDARSSCNAASPGLRWEGGADAIVLPTPDPMRLEQVGMGFADGAFNYANATWLAGGAGKSIGGGVRLQKISFSLCAGPPLRLEGRVALTAGEKPGGEPQFRLPDAGLIFKGGDPWSLRAEAPLATLERDRTYTFKDLFVEYDSSGAIDFGGKLDFAVDVDGNTPIGALDAAVRIDAGVNGFIQGARFNADLKARGCFGGTLNVLDAVPVSFQDVCPEVEGVVSSVGIAVCGGLKIGEHDVGRVGAGSKWGEGPRFMAGTCDLAPFRATKATASIAARGALAVDLPGGRRGMLVAIRGATAAPQVELRGPHGERVVTAADPAAVTRTSRAFAFSNAATRATYVVLAAPRGGRWTVVPAGDAELAGVRTAAVLPAPSVRAAVRGDGHRRALAYRVKPIPGQRVVFQERGRGVSRTLGATRRRHGTLRFRPADGRGGRRRIVAVVEQGGLPRRRLTVASYRAPARAKPGRPRRLELHRGTRSALLTWAGAARARRYGVRVALPDGRRLFYLRDAGERSVRVRGIPRRGRVSVRVVGLRADNSAGPAATAAASKPVRRSRRAS